MSDTPEFFWSKVRGEIERRVNEHVEVPTHLPSLTDWIRQHETALAAAAALLMFTLGVVWLTRIRHGLIEARTPTPVVLVRVENVATPIPDTVATVLQTGDDDVVVVWISGLPWTENMTEMKTLFAGLDT
jgi:hypothetical protein